ncbi:MAG: hypothetical protein ABR529_04930, partial [Actinomycetota bacterium]
EAKDTWRNIRDEMSKLHLGSFAGPVGKVTQRTELTVHQKAILKALKVKEPPRFLGIAPATGALGTTRDPAPRGIFPAQHPNLGPACLYKLRNSGGPS